MSGIDYSGSSHGRRPKLVIFDFDGTLVETESISAQVISGMLSMSGIEVSPHEISDLLSSVSGDGNRIMLETSFGVRLDENFMSDVRAAVHTAAGQGLDATPGSVEMLQRLDIPFCIASNTARPELIHRMRAANLFTLVGPRFFSAHDVGKRKPDPSVLLLAAEAMGVEPDDCLVVEDSAVGLEAARQANMRYSAFAGGRHHSKRLRDRLESYRPEQMILHFSDFGAFAAREPA